MQLRWTMNDLLVHEIDVAAGYGLAFFLVDRARLHDCAVGLVGLAEETLSAAVCVAPATGGGAEARPVRPHGTGHARTCACGDVTRPSATSAYAVPRNVSELDVRGRMTSTPTGHHDG